MSEAAVAGINPRAVTSSAGKKSTRRRALKAEVIEGSGAYDALLSDWRSLVDAQQSALLFQTPELLTTWARHFAGETLATVVVRHDDRPVLVWPLMVGRRRPLRVARGAGAPITQYDEVLLDPDAESAPALEAALDALSKSMRPDLVLLERVRADSALGTALRDVAPICGAEAAPYIDLSRGTAAALGGMKSNVAKKQRKRVRRFQKEGCVSFALAGDAAEAEAWIEEALALKRDWLKSTGRISRAFMKSETDRCLAELAASLRNGDPSPRMIVSRLTLNGRSAAFEAGFRHRDAYYLYLRAFAPDLAAFGPGNVLTEHMLGWCAENGVSRYDMMAPRSRNKSEWQSSEVAVLDFALPLSLNGRIYTEAVLKRLAPALRGAFYALPQQLRSTAAALTLRM